MASKIPKVLEERSMLRLFYILYREKKLSFSSIMNFFTIEVEPIQAQVMHRTLSSLAKLGLFKQTKRNDILYYAIDWNGVVGYLFSAYFTRPKEPKYDRTLVEYIKKHFLAYIHFGHKDTGTLSDAFIDVKESLHALRNFERIVKLNEEHR